MVGAAASLWLLTVDFAWARCLDQFNTARNTLLAFQQTAPIALQQNGSSKCSQAPSNKSAGFPPDSPHQLPLTRQTCVKTYACGSWLRSTRHTAFIPRSLMISCSDQVRGLQVTFAGGQLKPDHALFPIGQIALVSRHSAVILNP